MPVYVILGNYTQQGMQHIKDAPARIEAARKATEAAGGKWLGWYLTMGRYDFVAITESPSPEAAATVLLATGLQGNVQTETLQAFTEAELKGILANIP